MNGLKESTDPACWQLFPPMRGGVIMQTKDQQQPEKPCLMAAFFWTAAILSLPALAPSGAGASDNDSASAERELLARDLRLTVSVRRAIQEDQELAQSSIGVSVRQGVATLWGKVASENSARRALDRVRAVPGLVSVRSELMIGLPDDWPPCVPMPATPIRFHPAEKVPLTVSNSPQTLAADATTATPTTQPVKEPIVVMPAIPLPKPVPTTTSVSRDASADLAQEVARLRRSSGRYQGIEYTVQDGKVYLRGHVQRGADLTELAQAISRLPGVERVIVGNVGIEIGP